MHFMLLQVITIQITALYMTSSTNHIDHTDFSQFKYLSNNTEIWGLFIISYILEIMQFVEKKKKYKFKQIQWCRQIWW